VIGGVVVHDPRLPARAGHYLYSDYCGGELMELQVSGGRLEEHRDLGLNVASPTGFGVDGLGRVYVASGAGSIYRLDP
jgi:hypothetical protein